MMDWKVNAVIVSFTIVFLAFLTRYVRQCTMPRIVEYNGHSYIETGSAIHRSLCHDPDCKCGGNL